MELVYQHMKRLKITLLFKVFIVIILFCYVFYFFQNKDHLSHYHGDETSFTGIIKDIKKSDNKVTLIIKAKENLLVNYYTDETFDYKLGDYITINGTLSKPSPNTNFHLFNYQNYLLSKKIYYIISAKTITKVKNNSNLFYSLKQTILNRLNKLQNGYLKALIVGDNSSISSDKLSSYQNNGISHLLAISGMHVTILSSVILWLLNKINKKTVINEIIIILFFLFYAFLVSFSVSIIRASLMLIISRLSKLFKKKIKPLNIFFLTLMITLFINPFYLYSISFKYSYTICFYLIVFSKLINKRKNYIYKTFMTSLIAFLVSLPVQINNFYTVNFLSIVLNIFFVPFFSIIIFPLALITFLFPLSINLFNIVSNLFENMSLFCNQITFFKFSFAYINAFFYIYYYLIITLCFIKPKKGMVLFLISLFMHYHLNYIRNFSKIVMFDVGQGDSLLISLKHNRANILIDTGGVINYKGESSYATSLKTIIPSLKADGIKKLDYLILTHGDYDHMGEAINLVNNFKVDKVIFNCGDYNDLEQELINVLDKKKIPYYSCISDLTINDEKLFFLYSDTYDNENDNSNVIYFTYDNYKFLFMGDASLKVEQNLLQKYDINNIDVLKVGHHGSKTSSSREFIETINPKYALISAGKNNKYGHPSKETLSNLDDSNTYRTDLNGSIVFKFNKNHFKVQTCHN